MDHTAIEVVVGIHMAKGDHFAQAVTVDGTELFAQSFGNDQADIESLIDRAAEQGKVALVVIMTASVSQLLLTVTVGRNVPAAYVTNTS